MPSLKLIPIGQKFGRLTVISGPRRDQGVIRYECKCDCGHQDLFRSETLRNGGTRSCGCIRVEMLSERNRTHGESRTKLNWVWKGMHERCRNPKYTSYRYYGAKGIQVDPEFSSYEAFARWARKSGYQAGLTLERRETSLNYGPHNCVWANRIVQARNRSGLHHVTHAGKTLCLTEWSEETGIHRYTIFNRLRAGWPIERALQQKPKGSQCPAQ